MIFVDVGFMKNIVLILLMFSFAFANGKCGAEKKIVLLPIAQTKSIDTKKGVQCRCVCDKKISNMQRMTTAIEFYKNSKVYRFSY